MPDTHFLSHYGILGMKWGVRRDRGPNGRVSSGRKSQDDYIKDKRRTDVKNRRKLSDQELVRKIARLEKEKKLRELTEEEIDPGKKATSDILKSVGTKTATTVLAGLSLYGIKSVVSGKVNIDELADFLARGGAKKK